MEKEKILIVDDNREIVDSLGKLLAYEGYEILTAYDGMEALDVLEKSPVDLILLDVMMPRLNGLSTLMKIRERCKIPAIILSAKTEESDKVSGLMLGADDYVSKPYHPAELIARVKAQLRRYHAWGATEYKILELLMEHPGQVFPAEQIYTLVWKEEADYAVENTVMVHIRHIREKIEIDAKNPKYLKVVWGIGYKMEKYN